VIGYLKGRIANLDEGSCTIDVEGVGYFVYCSRSTLDKLEKIVHQGEDSTVMLYTRMIHREDTLDLYGFLEKAERSLFDQLIRVSGIGPKQAIKILGSGRVTDIVKAIVSEDDAFLRKFSGIGKKKSQQILLELRDKLQASFKLGAGERVSHYIEAVNALESLGFTKQESRIAVDSAVEEIGLNAELGKLVESALRFLASGR